jgi:hypothetical protein
MEDLQEDLGVLIDGVGDRELLSREDAPRGELRAGDGRSGWGRAGLLADGRRGRMLVGRRSGL